MNVIENLVSTTRITELSRPRFSKNMVLVGLKIQTWVKHNRALITQNAVLIFQITLKLDFILNLGLFFCDSSFKKFKQTIKDMKSKLISFKIH